MAIYSGTSGRRRGSVGNETYTITRGQNIVKEKVLQPLNPRTKNQQTQRAKFASAVRFFQFATRKFFKFAYEDKKSKESDYNAFMRWNIPLGVVFPADSSEFVTRLGGGEWPMLAPWKLTDGRLSAPIYTSDYVIDSSYPERNTVNFKIESDYYDSEMQTPTTFGELSRLIILAGMAEEGDILTFVCFNESGAVYAEAGGQVLPVSIGNLNYFTFRQIKVDVTNSTPLANLSPEFVVGFNNDDENHKSRLQCFWHIPSIATAVTELSAGDAVIRSRKITGGLEVSPSTLKLNTAAASFFAGETSGSYPDIFVDTWNVGESAILAGE